MSKTTPRTKAERCFAVARSTEHAGERENAISRGKAICEREGLDLDDFDIPGRARKVPVGGMNRGAFDIDLDLNGTGARYRESAFSSTQSDLFAAAMREAKRQAQNEDLKAAVRAAQARSEEMIRKQRAARAATENAGAARGRYEDAAARRQGVKCNMCGEPKWESRFGAPCYECVPLAS